VQLASNATLPRLMNVLGFSLICLPQ